MRDSRDFRLRSGVLELIAGIALSGVEGVWGTAVRPDHPEDKGKKKNLVKGIKIETDQRETAVDIDANMEFGRDFIALAQEAQRVVAGMIETKTGWKVVAVNVNVVGVNAL